MSEDNSIKWAEMKIALDKDPHVRFIMVYLQINYKLCFLQVVYYEAERVIPKEKYFYSPPTDPLWDLQWSLVSAPIVQGTSTT